MNAAYDSFDYPSYWTEREYEHKSEVIALNAFLSKIKKINTIIDVGCGFGRLFLNYSYRAKRIILADPSPKLLKIAKDTFRKRKNVSYITSSVQNLPNKTSKKADVVIMVRVIHHIDNPGSAFKALHRLVKSKGYLILEFANKRHAKAVIRSIFRHNLGFISSKDAADIRSLNNVKNHTLPFLNYHPEIISKLLQKYGFEVLDKRSVSNFRLQLAKNVLPLELVLAFERILQRPLSYFDFGPSIFVLARRVD